MESGMLKILLPFDHNKEAIHVLDLIWNKLDLTVATRVSNI